ncbi:MAG: LysM domain-containing protein [Planctomycetota bacterium]|nr:LysM domain-containing protein [Planctomycetota bacterium]
MFRILPIVLLLAIISPGCKPKPQPPQTTDLSPSVRPVETLEPVEPAPQPAAAAAAEPADKPVPPKLTSTPEQLEFTSYTIKKGDTLWSISKHFLGNGKRWREIVAVNPDLDPAKLRVGQTIRVPTR